MNSINCSRKSREHISIRIRRKLARHSNFACSICGAIPIVFHHIEEWAKEFSNEEELLLPICDKCHRSIHGEGGALFSKDELYDYKMNPKKPLLLSDKLPLERKKSFSFFVGSNFLAQGTKFSFFSLPDKYSLLSIDVTDNILKLNVLSEANEEKETYLIKDNELLIDTEEIWDMNYSRNSLKIWRMHTGKKILFIELLINPDVIIVKSMDTTFDGKDFRIYKLRKPQQRQINKITQEIKRCEEYYYKAEKLIDQQPRIGGFYDDIDIDEMIKGINKQQVIANLRQYLLFEYGNKFNWHEFYYYWIIYPLLEKSLVFGKKDSALWDVPKQIQQLQNRVNSIKSIYKKEFDSVEDVVVEYDGGFFLQNILT